MADQPIFSLNNQVITNQAMTGNITSLSQEISECNNVAVQVVWSAGSTPIGSTELQGSLDNVNFTNIDGTSLSVSGNSGSNLYNYDAPAFPFIRVVYTFSGGNGTLNAHICGKRG